MEFPVWSLCVDLSSFIS